MSRAAKFSKSSAGFTIVEVILALTMAVVMSGVLFLVTFRFYANAVQSQQAAELALESQSLLSQLTEDLRLASGINANSVIVDANRAGGWTTSDAQNVLVISSPATDGNDDIIYDTETGSPYMNEYVYFLEGTTMYKRTLRNTDAEGNTAGTTCPEATASETCLEDRIFSQNVTDISFAMYDSTNAAVTDATQSRSVEMTVDSSRNVFGKVVSLSNTTRITQRNF